MICRRKSLIASLLCFLLLVRVEWAYQFLFPQWAKNPFKRRLLITKFRILRQPKTASIPYSRVDLSDTPTTINPCYYKNPEGKWSQRINLLDLKVGQQLRGEVFQVLLDGKTGPKLFFDCGVGRIDQKGDWKIVTGMLRLGSRGSKKSVVAKRVARLRKQAVDLFVSKVDLNSARFEVCNSLQEVLEGEKKLVKKVPASTLKVGLELVGRVVTLRPYGAMVDVGANRKGLLHIQKVADLYGRYIDKEKGLEEAGLKVGTKIRVCVGSNENKRLFLDFTEDVKKEAESFTETSLAPGLRNKDSGNINDLKTTRQKLTETLPEVEQPSLSAEDEAGWAAYATSDESANGDESDYESDGEEYDAYDEDRDIEDALGLGTY